MVANAEARVHGTTPDHVHFHEVGRMANIIAVGLIADFDNRNPQHVVAGSEPQKDFGLHFQGLRAEGLNDVMTHGMTSSFWMGSG